MTQYKSTEYEIIRKIHWLTDQYRLNSAHITEKERDYMRVLAEFQNTSDSLSLMKSDGNTKYNTHGQQGHSTKVQ